MDHSRGQAHGLFRSFGTGGIWFPRGLLLRSAARHVCERLIVQWQAVGPAQGPGVDELCRKASADPALKADRVAAEIAATVRQTDAGFDGQVARMFTHLEEKLGGT